MQIADMHCDTVSAIYKARTSGLPAGLLSNPFQVDLDKMRRGGYLLQNFAVFVDIHNGENPYRCAKNQIAVFREEMEKNKGIIRQVRTMEDIYENKRAGRISALLTLEEGEACEGNLDKLKEFYKDGVRMMTFTWNYENSLAGRDGLTPLGIAFLEEMEALGIVPDVSHLPQAGFYDVCRLAKRPFVASHSNAAALCRHPRNLTDDMIRKIAGKGGVIGIHYYGIFLEEKPQDGIYFRRIKRIADHICHIMRIGGTGCVGLGSDFDGMDTHLELSDCSKMGLLGRELKSRGLSEREMEAVFCKNVLRIYKEYLKNDR